MISLIRSIPLVVAATLIAGCGAGGSRALLPPVQSADRAMQSSVKVLAGSSVNVLAGTMCVTPLADEAGCQVVSNTHARTIANPDLPAAQIPGYHPADLLAAYGYADVSGGAGRTVGIVDAYDDPNVESDLGVYRNAFGLPACTTANGCFRKVGLHHTHPRRASAGWSLETALDVQMVSAMCPQCNILLVETPDTKMQSMIAADAFAVQLGATDLSNSFYTAEFSTIGMYEQVLAGLNVPIAASAGDAGYGATYPASSAYVTAVGGTTLTRDSSARGWSETAWQWTSSGCSAYVQKPSWQIDAQCGNRTVADVSAVADPDTGVAVYNSHVGSGTGGWSIVGGTSVGAPLVAAMIAVAGTVGSVQSKPYQNATQFNAITSGTTVNCSPVSYLCSAMPGYNGPAGVGTPQGPAGFR